MDKKLLDYIKCVIDLEKSVYIQNKAIDRAQAEINSLGYPILYQQPEKPHEARTDNDFETIAGIFGFGAFIGGIIGRAFFGGIGLLLIFSILDLCSVASENKARWKKYSEEKYWYDEAVKNDNLRVEQENLEKDRLIQTLNLMKDKRTQTKALLQKYYDIGVIYPEYRGLIPMCSIYGYLLSERCPRLKGHDGAYNKYDTESHRRKIETQLSTVIKKLDQIKENQYMLFDAIQDGNRISQQIMDNSLQQIRLAEQAVENTALGAHYQQQAAFEANQMKNLMLYDHWHRSNSSY